MAAPDTVTDTIAAISTPPGRGGIGIVRLSGPQAASIAAQLVRPHQPLEHARARLADVLDLRRTGRTGPTYAYRRGAGHFLWRTELLHRGRFGRDCRARVAGGAGAAAAPRAGARRAVGRARRVYAEGIFGRPARSHAGRSGARPDRRADAHAGAPGRQPDGWRAEPVALRSCKQSLVELIALLEAGIDFAEDDVDVTPQTEIARRIDELTPPLTALEASFARGRIVHDGLTLAIVGRPNVGKSSLFNRLVERDRAIVTAHPGTTRDLVTERISLGGIPIELVDTRGSAAKERAKLLKRRSNWASAAAAKRWPMRRWFWLCSTPRSRSTTKRTVCWPRSKGVPRW